MMATLDQWTTSDEMMATLDQWTTSDEMMATMDNLMMASLDLTEMLET